LVLRKQVLNQSLSLNNGCWCKSCHDVTRCSCTPSRSPSSITDQPNQINQLLLRGTQSPLSPLTDHHRRTLSGTNDVASHFLAFVHYPADSALRFFVIFSL